MPSVTGLEHPFEAPPAPGTRLRVADGIDWIRQPLPFALDHVNCWLLGAAGGPLRCVLADAPAPVADGILTVPPYGALWLVPA